MKELEFITSVSVLEPGGTKVVYATGREAFGHKISRIVVSGAEVRLYARGEDGEPVFLASIYGLPYVACRV